MAAPRTLSRRNFLKAAIAAMAAPAAVATAAAAPKPRRGFGEPTFIGKSFTLEDTSVYVKRDSFRLEFFCYETQGFAYGDVSRLAHASF